MIPYAKIIVRSPSQYDGVLPNGSVVEVSASCEPARPLPIDVDLVRYREAGVPIEDPAGVLERLSDGQT